MKFFKNLKKDILNSNHKHNFISLLIVILIFIFDKFSKIRIINLQSDNNRIYVNEFVNIDLVWNTGIGFGLLSSSSNLFYNLLTTLIGVVIIFLIYLIINSKFADKILFSLVLGGAIGNLFDRITYSAVPDFIDIHYQNFHWFTFNIADIFITLGILTIILKDLLFKK